MTDFAALGGTSRSAVPAALALAVLLASLAGVAIGAGHVCGADAGLPVARRVAALAREHGLFLHWHSDADAITRQFKQHPDARILWARAGFDRLERVREMLRGYKNLWSGLVVRSDHAMTGRVDEGRRAACPQFPDRFLLGNDAFTLRRWHCVIEHAGWSRQWLADLPPAVAERSAWGNGGRQRVRVTLARWRGASGSSPRSRASCSTIR